MFDFRAPLFLILLVAIPVLIFVQRRAHRGTAQWRKSAIFFLRGTALLCAILALADLHRTHKEQHLAVVFLIDTSESIPSIQHEKALKAINTAVTGLKPTDRFGIIGFARETSILREVRSKQDLSTAGLSTVSVETLSEQTFQREGTDILTALKRAIALLPDNYHRRIVLFSDGIHNAGGTPIKDYLPLLSASDVEILTIPLETIKDAVQVVQLQLPTEVRKGQHFGIDVVIETDGNIPNLNATLYREDTPIDEFKWTLPSGRHVRSLLTEQISEEGSHTYRLKLNVTDEIPENNQAAAVVQIQDKPQVTVYAEGDLADTTSLRTVLEENGFSVAVMSATEMPTELVALQSNDVLILNNVPADVFSVEQQRHIENYVRDLGHGLVVIGGRRAYGPGGYTDTALERTLPVEMTPRERKDAVAIVFVLDTSGSMANYVGARQKIQLAIEGVRTGIRNLDAEDMAGILGFNTDVHRISDLISDQNALIFAVSKLRPTGGTTKIKEATEEAYEMLETNEAKRKHIVLLSDGKSDGSESDFLELAAQIAAARISLTTIAIGDANRQLLTKVAEISGGHPVFVENIQQLPEVLTEAVRETRRYIVQEPFQPTIVSPNEPIVAGIGTPPELQGYISTTEKETSQVFIRSHKDEPILAGWNFGLGKSVAWTSDVQPLWAKAWISWGNFGKFWGQAVNWVLPATDTDADFDLSVSLQHGVAQANIDTRTASQASYKLHVVTPDGTSESVEMQQRTPTRYSGTFRMSNSGAYIVTAQREGDAHKRTEVLSLSYPAEYAEFEVDTALLKMLAAGTTGIYEPTPTQITRPAGTPVEKEVSLARVLLVAAVLLFVLEMILRRFSLTNRYLTAFFERLRGKPTDKPISPQTTGTPVNVAPSDQRVTAGTTSPQPTEATMSRLLAAKRRAR